MYHEHGGPESRADYMDLRGIDHPDHEVYEGDHYGYEQSNDFRSTRRSREQKASRHARRRSVPLRRSRSCLNQREFEGRPVSTSPRRALVPRRPPPDEAMASPTLNLYHVSRPEPRASWVFNLSKFTQPHDKRTEPTGPPPERIASCVDEKFPNLGSLVWVNATLGGHCCLQKGTRTKSVTDIPMDVLDGWLNGQTGLWWLGALKEGHRRPWEAHVVINWAMVFIPTSLEVAARNNMEVWRDKCLEGSLRVARPGELARKLGDIVADDQDAEPQSVVHTHLCVLLADGDVLELRRPRMASIMPKTPNSDDPAFLTNGKVEVTNKDGSLTALPVPPRLTASKSNQLEPANPEFGATRSSSFPGSAQDGALLSGRSNGAGVMTIEEAIERAERYKDQIRSLKDDRQTKKAMVSYLKDRLRHKEALYMEENDRLRRDRNDLRAKVKMFRMDLETVQRESCSITAEEMEQLQYDVDRLRRERDDARAEAMRWLEQEQAKHKAATAAAAAEEAASAAAAAAANAAAAAASGNRTENGKTKANGHVNGVSSIHASPDGGAGRRSRGSSIDLANGNSNDAAVAHVSSESFDKDKAVIAKLRAKVDRLRLERDEAEEQAARWLNEQQQKMKAEMVAATAAAVENANAAVAANAAENVGNVNTKLAGGPVVASLKAESSRLRKELDETRAEAQRWREKASSSTTFGRTLPGFASVGLSDSTDSDNPEEASAQAKKALGQLLGKALNLLSPKAAAEAAAEVAVKAAATAQAAASSSLLRTGGAGGEDTAESNRVVAKMATAAVEA